MRDIIRLSFTVALSDSHLVTSYGCEVSYRRKICNQGCLNPSSVAFVLWLHSITRWIVFHSRNLSYYISFGFYLKFIINYIILFKFCYLNYFLFLFMLSLQFQYVCFTWCRQPSSHAGYRRHHVGGLCSLLLDLYLCCNSIPHISQYTHMHIMTQLWHIQGPETVTITESNGASALYHHFVYIYSNPGELILCVE